MVCRQSEMPPQRSVLCLGAQGRQFALGFLRGDEVRVGVLPNLEQLLVAPCRCRAVELRLRPRRSQQAENIVGTLCGAGRAFAESHGAVADARLKVSHCLLRVLAL